MFLTISIYGQSYFSKIIRVEDEFVGHVARIEEMRNAYKICFPGYLEGITTCKTWV